jgi:hypothetical protein
MRLPIFARLTTVTGHTLPTDDVPSICSVAPASAPLVHGIWSAPETGGAFRVTDGPDRTASGQPGKSILSRTPRMAASWRGAVASARQ